jgi:small subunit ribosomal protein S7
MPRRREVPKRKVEPDPKFKDVLVTQFIRKLMHGGKKSTAEKIFYGSLEMVEDRARKDALDVFKRAVENVKPQVEVKSRRVGGSTYQVPIEVSSSRQTTLAIRWIIGHARSRGGQSMADRLAAELLDASNLRGASVKKKEDVHRMAEANKAFAHYRWN